MTIRPAAGSGRKSMLDGYSCLLIDEADHLAAPALQSWLDLAASVRIPVILTFDPHHLLEDERQDAPAAESIALIEKSSTLSLSFSGNIRINRPVYAFLHTLLYLKNHGGHSDYSCIDVLYAGDGTELNLLKSYYTALGYTAVAQNSAKKEAAGIAPEYDRVLMILDETYFYDETGHLCVRGDSAAPLKFLYEVLSRTREKLCLIVLKNSTLFSQVLDIRLQRCP